ncbi:MAG TPA: hypothetical protein VGR35_07510 [Tepidisphaeraceae bacterium]|nr:hypothetical protein [Tepidisphaeraceae bacterium]
MDLLNDTRRYFTKPHVRPWALSSPILVLLICLPLLRPLRHPDPRDVSADETARLATVQALVEQGTLALDDTLKHPPGQTIRSFDGKRYSDQPPVMAVLLSGSYWIMYRYGLSLEENAILVPYLLTIIAVTLPVAGAAGLVYRMGRLFELKRPIRAGLGAAVVLGSGLLSYGVVLNAHAPAAVLVMCAGACFTHLAISKTPVSSVWLIIAGMCAALAATLEPAAAVFAVLLAAVPLAMRWRPTMKIGGVLLYVIGMTPPLVLHAVLTVPITGDLLPGMFHPELAEVTRAPYRPPLFSAVDDFDGKFDRGLDGGFQGGFDTVEEELAQSTPPSWWRELLTGTGRVIGALVGAHGLFSHFPILIFGVLGVGAIMHRHWPTATKVLAAATVAGASVVIITFAIATPAHTGSMFAARWFVVFLPMLLFWSGAWVRRRHHPVAWATAASLLLFSIVVSLLGATNPFPREGYDRYTAAEALQKLLRPTATVRDETMLAGG